MGYAFSPLCRQCGHEWTGEIVGVLFAGAVYRCASCGRRALVRHDQLTSARQRARGVHALTRGQLVRIVGRCECGGGFDPEAPVRCPECRSANVDQRADDNIILVD